jgi:hypothetical protein
MLFSSEDRECRFSAARLIFPGYGVVRYVLDLRRRALVYQDPDEHLEVAGLSGHQLEPGRRGANVVEPRHLLDRGQDSGFAVGREQQDVASRLQPRKAAHHSVVHGLAMVSGGVDSLLPRGGGCGCRPRPRCSIRNRGEREDYEEAGSCAKRREE